MKRWRVTIRRTSRAPAHKHATPSAGRMLAAAIEGIAPPLVAAIHTAMQSGHIGRKIAAAPGRALVTICSAPPRNVSVGCGAREESTEGFSKLDSDG